LAEIKNKFNPDFILFHNDFFARSSQKSVNIMKNTIEQNVAGDLS